MGVGAHPHHGRVGDGSLVEELQEIGRHHARYQREVDLAQQAACTPLIGQDGQGFLGHAIGVGVVAKEGVSLVGVFGVDGEGVESGVEGLELGGEGGLPIFRVVLFFGVGSR